MTYWDQGRTGSTLGPRSTIVVRGHSPPPCPLKWWAPWSGGPPEVVGPLKWWAPWSGGPPEVVGPLKWWAPWSGGPPEVVGPLKWWAPWSGGLPEVVGPLKWWAPWSGGPPEVVGPLKWWAPGQCPIAHMASPPLVEITWKAINLEMKYWKQYNNF